MKQKHKPTETTDEFEANSEQQLSNDLNTVRLKKTSMLTRGLELPKDSTTRARISFYSARDNWVKQAIALNYTDTEMCNTLKISGTMLAKIRARIFRNEIEALQSMSQLEHFVEYKLKQTEVVKDLDVLIEAYRGTKNLQGLSIALRTKQETLRELREAAQDVGLLDKKVDEVVFVNGQNAREMSNEELFNSIEEGYKDLQRIRGLLGNTPNKQSIQA